MSEENPYKDANNREYEVGFYASKEGVVFFFDGNYVGGDGRPDNPSGALFATSDGRRVSLSRTNAAQLTRADTQEIMQRIGKLEQAAQTTQQISESSQSPPPNI